MNLHLDKEGEIWHVEFTNDPEVGFALDRGQREAAADTQQATEAKVQVEKAGANAGVKPVLNRPIALNPDGKLPVQEVEKTFLQKFVSSPRTRVPRTDKLVFKILVGATRRHGVGFGHKWGRVNSSRSCERWYVCRCGDVRSKNTNDNGLKPLKQTQEEKISRKLRQTQMFPIAILAALRCPFMKQFLTLFSLPGI